MPRKAAGSPKKGKSPSAKMSTKYKKAPDAPKRFKSAFIIYSAEKHREIKKQLEKEGRPEKTTDIAKLVSESWKQLSPEDREEWELKAEKDRARYEAEKAAYTGPWKIPASTGKRSNKDPGAPKRPMSAFLAYSNSRRAALKRKYPKSTNADLSKMLSKSWKELPADEREKYMAEEAELRAKYKTAMATWRKQAAKQKKVERVQQKSVAREPAPPVIQDVAPSNRSASLGMDHGHGHSQMPDMSHQQQLLEQMQQQQEQLQQQQQLMAEQAGQMGQMGQMGDQMAAMRQQQEAMMAATGGGSNQDSGFDHQQQLGGGIFGGNNPYGLQGLGGFPGGMDAARALGLNSAAGAPSYLGALSNQFGAGSAAGGLSAFMNQPFNMSQLPQQGLNQSFNQSGLNQQGLNQGFYGNQLGGYGGLNNFGDS